MGLPGALTSFTSPIVDKALETGARGQTTTVTNYGVIGDAMFQKAQLDLNIAKLHTDMGMQKATLLSGLEMQKAELNLNKANILMNHDIQMKRLKMEQEANEVSDFEKVVGVLGGAASGAAAGYAVGGPVGAVAGGAIGGGTTYAGYQSGGRQGGESAQRAVGLIGNAAKAIKETHTENVAKKSMKEAIANGQKILETLNNPAATSGERAAAQTQWNEHIGKMQSIMVDQGMNMQQISEATAAYDKQMRFGGQDAPSISDQGWGKMNENFHRAINNPDFNDPKTAPAAKQAYIADQAIAHKMATGKDMSVDYRNALLHKLDSARQQAVPQQGIGAMPSPAPQTQVQPAPVNRPAQPAPVVAAPSAQTYTPMQPQRGAPIQQAAPAPQSRPVGTQVSPGAVSTTGGVQRIQPGVVMDAPPAMAEQNLAAQGAKTVKALQKEEDSKGGWDLNNDGEKGGFWKEMTAPYQKRGEDGENLVELKNKNQALNKDIEAKRAKLAESGFAGEGSQDLSAQVSNASSAIDEMIKEVEDSYPTGSAVKGFGADVHDKGFNMAPVTGAVGAVAGGAAGSLAGPAGAIGGVGAGMGAGAYLGKDVNVGRGSGLFLNDKEEKSVGRMAVLKKDVIPAFARTGDPGSAVREFEAAGYDELLPDPRRSKEDNINRLITLKERLAQRIGSGAETSMSKRMTDTASKHRDEQIEQMYESNPAKIYQEELMRQRAKKFMKPVTPGLFDF